MIRARAVATRLTSTTMNVMTSAWAVRMFPLAKPVERSRRLTPLLTT
jgi:hypothetical protein